jgi:opacity protein-like surface antigen
MAKEGRLSTLRTFTLAVVILAGAAAPVRADGFVTPFYGFNFGGDSASNCQAFARCEEKRKNFGVSFGTMGTVVGFEEDISFAKDFYGAVPGVDNSIFTMMSNLLIGIGRGPVQPYVLVGAGLVRSHTAVTLSQFHADNNSLGYDIGGGVNAFVTPHVGIRGDIRHVHTLQDLDVLVFDAASQVFVSQKLDFWRASVGVAFRF